MNGQAAAEIVEEVRPGMVRFARWLGLDRDTAEDFPQEFYLFLLRFEGDVVTPGRLATRMVWYYALNEWRRRGRHLRLLRSPDGTEVPAVDLLVDTTDEDAYRTSTQHYGGRRDYRFLEPQPVGTCWECRGPTNRPNPYVRYCLECVKPARRYTGSMTTGRGPEKYNDMAEYREGLWAFRPEAE